MDLQYFLYKEDVARVAALGINAHSFSWVVVLYIAPPLLTSFSVYPGLESSPLEQRTPLSTKQASIIILTVCA